MTARDGVRLVADAWRPAAGRYPTLVMRQPSGRRRRLHCRRSRRPSARSHRRWPFGTCGPHVAARRSRSPPTHPGRRRSAPGDSRGGAADTLFDRLRRRPAIAASAARGEIATGDSGRASRSPQGGGVSPPRWPIMPGAPGHPARRRGAAMPAHDVRRSETDPAKLDAHGKVGLRRMPEGRRQPCHSGRGQDEPGPARQTTTPSWSSPNPDIPVRPVPADTLPVYMAFASGDSRVSRCAFAKARCPEQCRRRFRPGRFMT